MSGRGVELEKLRKSCKRCGDSGYTIDSKGKFWWCHVCERSKFQKQLRERGPGPTLWDEPLD